MDGRKKRSTQSIARLPPLSSHSFQSDSSGQLSHVTSSLSHVRTLTTVGSSQGRSATSALPRDVVADPQSQLYVALWQHNRNKWARALEIERVSRVATHARNELDIETVVQEEEGLRLKVLTGITESLVAEVEDGKRRQDELDKQLGRLDDPSATVNDPVLKSLQSGIAKRQADAQLLRQDIERKRKLLASKRDEVSSLRNQINEALSKAAALRGATEHTATLSEYLPLSENRGEEEESMKDGTPLRKSNGATTCDTQEEWLNSLRRARGEVLGSIFEETNASPLTMLLSAKANIGPYRDAARRMLDTIDHLSPATGVDASFNGAAEHELFDVSAIAKYSTKLEEGLGAHQTKLEMTRLFLNDPDLMRILDTFQRYEDPRGTIPYVTTTPKAVLLKNQQALLQMFEGINSPPLLPAS